MICVMEQIDVLREVLFSHGYNAVNGAFNVNESTVYIK